MGECSHTVLNMSQSAVKAGETDILASPVAVLPPALRNNRTHHEETLHLKHKYMDRFDQNWSPY